MNTVVPFPKHAARADAGYDEAASQQIQQMLVRMLDAKSLLNAAMADLSSTRAQLQAVMTSREPRKPD